MGTQAPPGATSAADDKLRERDRLIDSLTRQMPDHAKPAWRRVVNEVIRPAPAGWFLRPLADAHDDAGWIAFDPEGALRIGGAPQSVIDDVRVAFGALARQQDRAWRLERARKTSPSVLASQPRRPRTARSAIGARTSQGGRKTRSLNGASSGCSTGGDGSEPGGDPPPSSAPRPNEGEPHRGTTDQPVAIDTAEVRDALDGVFGTIEGRIAWARRRAMGGDRLLVEISACRLRQLEASVPGYMYRNVAVELGRRALLLLADTAWMETRP